MPEIALELERLTLPALLLRSARAHADAPALRFLSTTWTYRRLLAEVAALARGLAGLGVGRGSAVAVHMPNLPQSIVATYAVLSLGGRVVITNPLYTAPELEHQWHDAGCEVLLGTDALYVQRVAEARPRLGLSAIVLTSIPETLPWPLSWLARRKLAGLRPPAVADVPAGPGLLRWRDVVAAGRREVGRDAALADDSCWEDVAVLQYTGGTTGVSKGAMLTHGNLSANVQQLRAWLHVLEPGREVFLAALPYFHVFGLTVSMHLPLAIGGCIVVLPDPRDTRATLEAIVRHGVTVLPAVPAMFHALVDKLAAGAERPRRLKACVSGSAPLPHETLRRFEELTGSTIVEGYGLTETSPVTHCNPLTGLRKPGTVGLPVPLTRARIVEQEEGRREMGVDEVGELLVAGPQVMAGYWKQPEETALSLRDGWLHTGDLAAVDADGYYRIAGRKKDAIKTGGYLVFPDEIDRVLGSHPAVAEACSVGLPDERLGETIKAFVVLKRGASATAEELLRHARESLAAYKVPRAIEFRAELPRSAVMKLLRRTLRDEELAKRRG